MAVGRAEESTPGSSSPAPDGLARLPAAIEDFVDVSLGLREALPNVDGLGLLGALGRVFIRPRDVAREGIALAAELTRVGLGRVPVDYAPRDWRFANPAWSENPVYRRLGQSYLAWSAAMHRLIDDADLDWQTEARARFAMTLLTTAAAPSNFLLTNPDALERIYETGGKSLVRGARNIVRDVRENSGMPRSVDRSHFVVGVNQAATPGSVVYRDELLELIQYDPTTPTVFARASVVIPPQINRFYVMDMAPGRSFVEHAVSQGVQTFMVSWRNPGREHGHWDLDTYLRSLDGALDAVAAITGVPDPNLVGICAGGITTAAYLGYLAALGERRVNSVSFAVTLLDFSQPTMLGMLANPDIVGTATANSSKEGVLDGRSLGNLFAALRPNDLVWNYWVANNLLGNDPPRFDILAWNSDTTRMPAALHADFLRVFLDDHLAEGKLQALGCPVELDAIDIDSFVVAGATDHLTPWRSCYATTQLLGGKSEFVLCSSGHVQSLVNPAGNTKMSYLVGGEPGPDPDAWRAAATSHPGSWWEHWVEWIGTRSGPRKAAPKKRGNRAHPPLEPAPGRYVLEQ